MTPATGTPALSSTVPEMVALGTGVAAMAPLLVLVLVVPPPQAASTVSSPDSKSALGVFIFVTFLLNYSTVNDSPDRRLNFII